MATASEGRCGVCNLYVNQDELNLINEERICKICIQALDGFLVTYPKGFVCPVCGYEDQNSVTVHDHSKKHNHKLQICDDKKCSTICQPKQMKKHVRDGHSNNYFKFRGTWYRRF